MRQVISGLIAAVAVMTAGAAPAMACGYTACSPCSTYLSPCATTYVPAYVPAPSYVARGCTTGCGYTTYERLSDPDAQFTSSRAPQYYYVNQGPTFSGPGEFAPHPVYREAMHPYHWRHHYTFHPRLRYGYGHRAHRYY
jgi:hypothetical protein